MPKSERKPLPEAAARPAAVRSLNDPKLFLDPDRSLLAFQRRVLEEAQDETHPLLERVKFLGILASNVDEFAIIRGSELGRISARPGSPTVVGADARDIRLEYSRLLADARRHLYGQLVPALAATGIHILDYKELTAEERIEANAYFAESILPVLMPLAVDASRPFPHLANLALNIAVLVRDVNGHDHFACLRVPDGIPQFVPVRRIRKGDAGRPHAIEQGHVWIEQVIVANLGSLFPGLEVREAHAFRIIRYAEIHVTNEQLESGELLDQIEESVRRRHFGEISAVVADENMPPVMLDFLVRHLKIEGSAQLFRVDRPLAAARLMDLLRIERPDLRDAPLSPRIPARLQNADLFAAIREGESLLHHPYESFQPVMDFLRQAARDPDVLAISITLYRVGRDSPVVAELLEAARRGKQVRVVVELRARFDEASNVAWARELKRAGAHVSYGVQGLKVHAKLALVVRREGRKLRRYVHLTSGNYNPVTARLYTDIGLLTCDEEIAADAAELFNFLSGHGAPRNFRKLIVAPLTLRARIRELIEREIAWAERREPARLAFKMNALMDRDMIRLLYRASQAGVHIDLLVRGVCELRPGLPGVSENIQVRSIVGRFLEHSRIYYFRNGGDDEIYIGSADLRARNLDRRVEVLFPVEDPGMHGRVRDGILRTYFADNVKARALNSDGTYVRLPRAAGEARVNSQEAF